LLTPSAITDEDVARVLLIGEAVPTINVTKDVLEIADPLSVPPTEITSTVVLVIVAE